MKNPWKLVMEKFGPPKVYVTLLLLFFIVAALFQKQDVPTLFTAVLVRVCMNSVLVLSMVPGILAGIGPNFAVSVGMVFGLLAAVMSIQFGMKGYGGLFFAIVLGAIFAAIVGWLYGILLNRVKGDEMAIATYTGFSIVSLMTIAWVVLPFTHPLMIWPYGGTGLRATISLEGTYKHLLDNLIPIAMPGTHGNSILPIGTAIVFVVIAFILWFYLRTKAGVALKTAGSNPKFATASGVDVDRQRVIGTTISMVLGAIGIIIYAQSFGFLQLYTAPLNMPFWFVSAILIGGATARKANVSNVISGSFLFFALLAIALPVINKFMTEGNFSEIVRIVVSNGVILYALTQVGGKE